MALKLWEKTVQVNHDVESYTVGRDRDMDMYLAPYDVLGSIAHVKMLNSIGLIGDDELEEIVKGLKAIYEDIKAGKFIIEDGVEDVHSQEIGRAHV